MNKAFGAIEYNYQPYAGRTDTGVHAKEMYAHFDFETPIDVARLVHKLNSLLPKDIVVYDIIPVHDQAHLF
jgi:tRNA pseudouridine38-40 synthase